MVAQPGPAKSDGLTPIKLAVRDLVRRLFEDGVEREGWVDYATIASTVRDMLLNRPEIMQYIGDLLYLTAITEGRKVAASKRDSGIAAGGRHTIVKPAFSLQVRASRWTLWTEHSGGQQVSLLKLKYDQLIDAAVQRELQGTANLQRAAFLRGLANGLVAKGAPSKEVGEVLTDEEITTIQEATMPQI